MVDDPRFPDGPSTQAYIKPEDISATPGGDSVKDAVLKNDTNMNRVFEILNDDLATIIDPDYLMSIVVDNSGTGTKLDADLFDGRDSDTFASVGKTAGASLDDAITSGMFQVMTSDGPAGTLHGTIIVARDIGGLHCFQIIAGVDANSEIWWRTGRSADGATFTDWTEWKEFGEGGGTPGPTDADTLDGLDSTSYLQFPNPMHAPICVNRTAGVADAGRGILLDTYGMLDPSFVSVRVFNPSGNWTPTPAQEYPSPVDPGDFWIIESVDTVLGYTFTGGYLAGETIFNGEFLVKGRDATWAIVHSKVDPGLYYKLDGTNHLTADFMAGGFQLKDVADGVDDTDAVTVTQLDTKLGKTDKAADSQQLDGRDSTTFADADHGHSDATQADPGFMSVADKTKLDNLDPGGGGWEPELNNVMELGADLGIDASARIDFHTQASPVDYNFVISRNSGINGDAVFQQLGTGDILFNIQSGAMRINNSLIWTDDYHPINLTDADTLDGLDSTAFARLAFDNQFAQRCIRNSPDSENGFVAWMASYNGRNIYHGQTNGVRGWANYISSYTGSPGSAYTEPLYFISHLIPNNDNTYNLGSSLLKIKEVFSNAVFSEGDETKIRNVSTVKAVDADFLLSLVPKTFEIIPEGISGDPVLADVAAEATTETRLGFVAQDVDTALVNAGHDPDDFAITTGGTGERCVNMLELVPLLVKKIQDLELRLAILETV